MVSINDFAVYYVSVDTCSVCDSNLTALIPAKVCQSCNSVYEYLLILFVAKIYRLVVLK